MTIEPRYVAAKSGAARPDEAPLSAFVKVLSEGARDLWWACDDELPSPGRTYAEREQAARESHLARALDAAEAELKRPPRDDSERRALRARLTAIWTEVAKAVLDLDDRHVEAVAASGFADVATDLAREARRLDAALSAESIFQASRNACTMNALQMLLGLPVRLTPSVFAYSLLYPYTDNYLDDPGLSPAGKLAFNARLARRLAGEDVEPTDERERRIWGLVALIEGEFERARWPRALESLQWIHRAQARSAALHRAGASPYEVDVLGIGLEKGGASVLADAYLVAGRLAPEQARFAFAWGALLQLVDDLQDVEQDARDGILTVFSQTARRWPLDAVTSRVFFFADRVLGDLDCFDAPGCDALKDLVRRSAVLMLLDGAGTSARLYSAPYLLALERHSPCRFAFLRRVHDRLGRRRGWLTKLVDAFAGADPT